MYELCCYQHARNTDDLSCSKCHTRFIRCPVCNGLMSEYGLCTQCINPTLELKCGMELKENSRCSVPARIINSGESSFRVQRLTYLVPGHSESGEVRAGFRIPPGGVEEFTIAFDLDRAGEYAIEVDAEIEWEYGKRLGFRYTSQGVVTAKTRDALIRSEGGTGNMIYVSGATSDSVANHMNVRGSSAVSFQSARSRVLDAVDLEGFGDDASAVSLCTELRLPDLLLLSKGRTGPDLIVPPDPKYGILLGRDRPGPDSRNHAVLRVPSRIRNAADLTMSLSSTHWCLRPVEGFWQLEVIGRRPSLVGTTRVHSGESIQLSEGDILCPIADRPSALRLQLKHVKTESGRVFRSKLKLL